MSDWQDFTYDLDEFWRESGIPVEARLAFNYRNPDGTYEAWEVTVLAFIDDPEAPLLRGHGPQRDDMRTFAIRDITTCSDAQTGQPIADVLGHLQSIYRRTPAHTLDRIVHNHVDTLRALLYIMQCSGFSAANQLDTLTQICRHLGRDERVANRHVAPLVVRYRNASEQVFCLLVRRLAKQLNDAGKHGVLKLASRIASHNGKSKPAAQDALELLAKSLGKNK